MVNTSQNESATQQSSVDVAQKRKKAAEHFFWMSIFLIGISAGSIIFGILMNVYKEENNFAFSKETRSPIWSGAVLLLSGIICYFVSKMDIENRNQPSPTYIKRINVYRVINVVSLGINMIAAGLCSVPVILVLIICFFSAIGGVDCPVKESRAWDIVALILSIILCISNDVGFVLFRIIDKALKSDGTGNTSSNIRNNKVNPVEGGNDTQRNIDPPQQNNNMSVDPPPQSRNVPNDLDPPKQNIDMPSDLDQAEKTLNMPSDLDPPKQNITMPSDLGPAEQILNMPTSSDLESFQQSLNMPSNLDPPKQNINMPSDLDPAKQSLNMPSDLDPPQQNIKITSDLDSPQLNISRKNDLDQPIQKKRKKKRKKRRSSD